MNLNRGRLNLTGRMSVSRWEAASPVLDVSNVAITDRYISHLYPGEAIETIRVRAWGMDVMT